MKRFLLVLLFILFCIPTLKAEMIRDGFLYERDDEANAHIFRIDPKKYGFDLIEASTQGYPALAVRDMRAITKALLVINGGYFDENFKSLGLLKTRKEVRNPLRPVSWGIFYMGGKDGRTPFIIPQSVWLSVIKDKKQKIGMALQVGPRLVVDGNVQSVKERAPARRSAVGVTENGWVLLAISEKQIMLQEWAEYLKKKAPQVLNLDGGSSTQISSLVGKFVLEVTNLGSVTNGIGVFASP